MYKLKLGTTQGGGGGGSCVSKVIKFSPMQNNINSHFGAKGNP